MGEMGSFSKYICVRMVLMVAVTNHTICIVSVPRRINGGISAVAAEDPKCAKVEVE